MQPKFMNKVHNMNEIEQTKKEYQAPKTNILGTIGRWLLIICTAIVLIIAAIFYFSYRAITNASADIDVNSSIDVTPTQIESMKQIGEWEFLSISDEEMIDTLRRGFFSDDELIRIYYGTLRLGINMHKTKPHFIKMEKDTLIVTLPPIELLDENFIDEARTKAFYESGSWDDQTREDMYQRAVAKMKERCLTSANITSAQQNASRQFYQLMRSMGHENVKITFDDLNLHRIKRPALGMAHDHPAARHTYLPHHPTTFSATPSVDCHQTIRQPRQGCRRQREPVWCIGYGSGRHHRNG